jgi:hypothetical protein
MFVRFRQTPYRLQLSIVETRRANGKVRHEHVASLGSVPQPLTVAKRVTFWAGLHERLGRLSNRLDAAARAKLMDEVHARVPMVTADERQAMQLEAARTNAKQQAALRDVLTDEATSHRLTAKNAATREAITKAAADALDNQAKTSQAHVEAIERGETVEGAADEPEDLRALLKTLGFTAADLRHFQWMAATIPEDRLSDVAEELTRLRSKSERRRLKRAARTVLRRHGLEE